MKGIRIWIMVFSIFVWSPGTALAETYIEGYLGNDFAITSPNPIGFSLNPGISGPHSASPEYPRNLCSAIIGGVKFGTWFVKEGFPGFTYPDWMKYFGVYLDASYHWLNYDTGVGSRHMYFIPENPPGYQHYKFLGHGSVTTLAFMFAFRYGFHPTEKVPFGKIQPYVAVGPALMITSLGPTLMFQPGVRMNAEVIPIGPQQIPYKTYGSFSTTVGIGLEAETGVRWMITRFLSLDTSVKYRYARPTIGYDLKIYNFTNHLTYAPELNLFSVQAGVAYHF